MSSARHTSPDLSRRLRDAGLEQAVGEKSRYVYDRYGALVQRIGTPCKCANCRDNVRALDLHEVLEELRRERTGGPLALYVGVNVHPAITAVEAESNRTGPGAQGYARHTETVEAAGMALAQLLEARRG